MARGRIGGFRDDAARDDYLAVYDEIADRWPLPAKARDVATSFGTTRVRRSGPSRGVPLVLLHDLPGTSLSWAPHVAALSINRPTWAVDLIGAPGASVQERALRKPRDLAAWVDEVMAGLALGRSHLLGVGHGAVHALLTSRHRPGRLRSVTAIEPGLAMGSVKGRVRRRLDQLATTPTAESTVRLQPGVTMGADQRRLVAAATAAGHRSWLPRPRPLTDEDLGLIRVPTLLLFGKDTVVGNPHLDKARARRLMPTVEAELFSSAGHDLLAQYPELVLARVDDFLRAREPRGLRPAAISRRGRGPRA